MLESQLCSDFPIKNLLTAEKHGDSDRPSGFDPLPLAGRCHASDSWYRYVCALEAPGNPPRINAWTNPAEGWGERTRRFLDNGGKVLVIGDELMAWLWSSVRAALTNDDRPAEAHALQAGNEWFTMSLGTSETKTLDRSRTWVIHSNRDLDSSQPAGV